MQPIRACSTHPSIGGDSIASRARVRAVRFGGDCYTPCMVAAGCADLVIETGLKPWDVQALIPIIEAAGGVITSWAGERADCAHSMVVAGNRELHRQVIELLNDA